MHITTPKTRNVSVLNCWQYCTASSLTSPRCLRSQLRWAMNINIQPQNSLNNWGWLEDTTVIRRHLKKQWLQVTIWIHYCYQPPPGKTTVTNHHMNTPRLPTTIWRDHSYQPPHLQTTVTNYHLKRLVLPTHHIDRQLVPTTTQGDHY